MVLQNLRCCYKCVGSLKRCTKHKGLLLPLFSFRSTAFAHRPRGKHTSLCQYSKGTQFMAATGSNSTYMHSIASTRQGCAAVTVTPSDMAHTSARQHTWEQVRCRLDSSPNTASCCCADRATQLVTLLRLHWSYTQLHSAVLSHWHYTQLNCWHTTYSRASQGRLPYP